MCRNRGTRNSFCRKFNDFATFFSPSDYLFKLLLIGDSGVGKSCLLLRFAVSKCDLFYFAAEYKAVKSTSPNWQA